MKFTLTPAACIVLAVSLATLHSASAQTVAINTVAGNLPTCSTMLTNCDNFATRAIEAAGPGGIIPENITQNACNRMYHRAEETGTWPANQPFGFAMSCTTDGDTAKHHFRHRFFVNQDGAANQYKPNTDPAGVPTTPQWSHGNGDGGQGGGN